MMVPGPLLSIAQRVEVLTRIHKRAGDIGPWDTVYQDFNDEWLCLFTFDLIMQDGSWVLRNTPRPLPWGKAFLCACKLEGVRPFTDRAMPILQSFLEEEAED
jgi:hypothetical protein